MVASKTQFKHPKKGRRMKIMSTQGCFPKQMRKEVWNNKTYFKSSVWWNISSAVNTEENIAYRRGN